MIQKILCFLGIHDYEIAVTTPTYALLVCQCCRKEKII